MLRPRKEMIEQEKRSKRRSTSESAGAPDPVAPAAGAAAGAPTAGAAAGAPTAGAWFPAASVGTSFVHDLSPSRLYPPGGFMNFLQPHPFVNYPSGSQIPENFHLVGAPMSQSTVSPTVPCSKGTPSPSGSTSMNARDAQMGSLEKESIDIDDDDTLQPARSEVRLNWTHEEDIRLVSAWLQNSIDPIDGNDKKADQYWGDVTTTYNSTTESNRKRNRNQLKIRWEHIKKPVSEFHGCWIRTTKIYQSGVSDDQLMDQAFKLYASEHNEKPFTLQHAWSVLQHERKWSTYVKKLLKEKDNSATRNPAHVVNVEDNPTQRPMGHKRAKEEQNGKRKASDVVAGINEKLEKFIEASTMAREGREKMAAVQESLANKKVEAAKLAHKTACEKTKCKMLETFKDLLFAPTSHLSEQTLAERDRALESMRKSLFAKDD